MFANTAEGITIRFRCFLATAPGLELIRRIPDGCYLRWVQHRLKNETVLFGFLLQGTQLLRCCLRRIQVELQANGFKTNRNLFRNAQCSLQVQVAGPEGNKRRLVGVEYIVDAATWLKNHNNAPPSLEGQDFQFVGAPNRFNLAPFFELHVWAWRENPQGAFVDWNNNVTCERQ